MYSTVEIREHLFLQFFGVLLKMHVASIGDEEAFSKGEWRKKLTFF